MNFDIQAESNLELDELEVNDSKQLFKNHYQSKPDQDEFFNFENNEAIPEVHNQENME